MYIYVCKAGKDSKSHYFCTNISLIIKCHNSSFSFLFLFILSHLYFRFQVYVVVYMLGR